MPKTVYGSLRLALQTHYLQVFLVFFLIVLGNVLSYSIPYFLKLITEYVTETPSLDFEYQALIPIAIIITVVYLFQEISFRVAHYFEIVINIKVYAKITSYYFSNLMFRPSSYFEDTFSGKLSRRIEQIGTSTKFFLKSFLWEFGWSIPAMVVSAILMYIAHPLLGHGFVIWMFIFIVTSYPLLKGLYVRSKQVAERGARLDGEIVDSIANVNLTHSFAAEKFERKRLHYGLSDLSKIFMSEGWWFLGNKLHQGLSVVSLSLILIYISIYLFGKNEISVGDFVLVASTIPLLSGVIWNMGDMVLNVIRNYGNLQDALDDLATDTERLSEGDNSLETYTTSITFDAIAFNYKNATFAFQNFSLHIKQGERVGIVGSSGAGKSTLFKLLLRQYDPDFGVIKIGKQNIKDVTVESLRQNVAFVPQDTTLFHRSLLENIQYAKPDATLEEVVAVSKKAHAHEFIQTMPEQYSTKVGERGVKLSGGQRQRIAIARAMLKDAPILVLDEATSALDGESEQIVQDGFHKLFEGRTVIAVAHRLSTLREMDRIIVMEDGQIVEDGSPNELLKKENGIFRKKWDQQKGGFVA